MKTTDLRLLLSKTSCIDLLSPKPSNSTFNKDSVLPILAEMLNSLMTSTDEESFDRFVSHIDFLFLGRE
jgi:hypothetical protein